MVLRNMHEVIPCMPLVFVTEELQSLGNAMEDNQ
jgi:hypothetical protein